MCVVVLLERCNYGLHAPYYSVHLMAADYVAIAFVSLRKGCAAANLPKRKHPCKYCAIDGTATFAMVFCVWSRLMSWLS